MNTDLPPSRVHAARARAVTAIRAVALAMVVLGTLGIANRLLYAILGIQNLTNGIRTWSGIGTFHGIFLGLPLLAAGVALAALSSPLARWIVRPPDTTCPRCNHAATPGISPCPECGYPLTVTPATPPPANTRG